jgi:hypothetical protein
VTDDVSAAMTSAGPTHVPDDHAGHDRQLVVAFACGDLPIEDISDAQALVSRCRRCAALVDEIARISAATSHDLVAPPRPRDFRLTADDAARLRGGLLGRLMHRLGGPRLQVLQPLAGAAMAVGIVLLVTTAVLPSLSGAGGAAPAALTTVGSAIGDDAARDASGGAGAPSAEGVGGAEIAPAGPVPAPAASAAASPQAAASPDIAASTDTSTKANATELATTPNPFDPIVPVGLGLLVLGAIVLIVRLVALRASKDPLLR